MKALVHYPSLDEAPVGIWWVDPLSGEPDKHYLDPSGADAARGSVEVFAKTNPDVSWEKWFESLAERVPYSLNWETVEMAEGQDPHKVFDALKSHAQTLLRKKK